MNTVSSPNTPVRDVANATWRGLRCRCPHCGEGKMFRAFLKVNDHCPKCGEALYHHRADDAPPYVVITIVGHIIIGGMLVVEQTYSPDLWLQTVVWVPLAILMSLALLPLVKGALIGLQWALRMHGFDPNSPESQEAPASAVAARSR